MINFGVDRSTHRLAAAGLVASLILTGCSSPDGSEPAAPKERPLVSMTKPGQGEVDLITWNLTSGEPDTLNPPDATSYGGGQVVMNLCDTLMRYDADYNISPGLVDFEQVSPTELVYTLRGGAKFWDGTPVTAEDVAYSLERSRTDSVVSIFFSSVRSIEVTGNDEVTVRFKSPDYKFNTEMTNISGVVVQKDFAERVGDDFGTAAGGLMCSGPFEFVDWTPGDSINIARNDDYWDRDRVPLAQQVRFTFVSDANVVTQALKTGEIDGSYELPPSTIPALGALDVGELSFGPSTTSVSLYAANPEGIVADPDFMAGMQRLIDREALADGVYNGAGEALYTYLTPRTWPTDQTEQYAEAYRQYVESRSYDLVAAKEAIDASAYDGEEVVLAYQAGDPTAAAVVQLIQQQASQATVKIKLQSMGALAFQQAAYNASKREGIDLLLTSGFNSVADPLEPALFSMVPDGPTNYAGYNDPVTTELLQRALAEPDPDSRAQDIIAAQRRWEDANVVVPLVSTHEVSFLNSRLTGTVTSMAYWSMPSLAWVGSPL